MASDSFIYDPLETDRDLLQQEAFDYIATRWPDWDPNDGNLEAWLIAACANMVAEARDIAADVPRAIFRYYGQSVFGIPPIDPLGATVTTTWTLKTNPAGRTINGGWLVGIEDDQGEVIPFEVQSDVFLASGVLATTAGQVVLRAIDEGTFANGLGGAGIQAIDQESSAWVNTITMTAATAGGTDGETDDEYLGRLSARLTLMSPRPILARDFALLSKDIAAQLGVNVRVLVIDGYDPATDTLGNERMVTIFMIDAVTGANVSAAVQTAVDDELETLREVNFIINTANPTRTNVKTTAEFTVLPGFDIPTVEAAVADALNNYYLSANWGAPINSEGFDWINKDRVRRLEVATVINNVAGVNFITSLKIALGGASLTELDEYVLPGTAPLTQPGAIITTGSPTI